MPKDKILVKRGQYYKVPRAGKVAAVIRIMGVRRSNGQPRISYERVTRAHKPRYPRETITRWLEWGGRAWRLPATWELQA